MSKMFLLIFIIFCSCGRSGEEEKVYAGQLSAVKERIAGTNYNAEYTILVDFSIHSGKRRMFLYNLKTNRPENSFLVAHGEGCGQKNGRPEDFSNISGSLCSSEGFAVIGNRDYSRMGINYKYWLEGLDATNNKMRERIVVIHSWAGIPDIEIYPFPIVQSQGCFTVSDETLRQLDRFIKEQENKKILLYAFQM